MPPDLDKHTSQTDRDRIFLERAFTVAKDTDDPKAKIESRSGVGAVIVRERKIVGESANRLPAAIRELYTLEDPFSEERYHFLEHAERSVIYTALAVGEQLDGSTIYCTRFPCSDCARAIIAVGIKRIVVAKGFADEGDWVISQRSALKLFRLAGTTVRYLDIHDLD